jgi:50S ribosomal protein L16 3-hydroxylase
MAMTALSDREAFARWFGTWNSLPKYADADWRPEEPTSEDDVRASLHAGVPLIRNPASRFSFIRQQGSATLLFVDGQGFDCPGEIALLAEQLCAAGEALIVDPGLAGSVPAVALIVKLIDQGSLAFEDALDGVQ